MKKYCIINNNYNNIVYINDTLEQVLEIKKFQYKEPFFTIHEVNIEEKEIKQKVKKYKYAYDNYRNSWEITFAYYSNEDDLKKSLLLDKCIDNPNLICQRIDASMQEFEE